MSKITTQVRKGSLSTRTRRLTGAIALLAAASLSAIAQVPTTGLGLWLKGDAGVTLNGTTVSEWVDQSTAAQILAQADASRQPTLVASRTGKPALRFDGVNDFLPFNLSINDSNGVSIFMVANNNLVTQNGGTAYSDSPAIFWNETVSWGWVFLGPFQTNVNWRFGTTTSGNNLRYPRPASIGDAYSLTTLVKNGEFETLYVNRNLALQVDSRGYPLAGVANNAYLGRGSSTYFSGEILEVLVYTEALSDTDRQTVENYLHNKYLANQQPTVAITSPADFASFDPPANITITADALDDSSITNVEFFANGASIGNDTTVPYSVTWNNVPGGAYGLTVKATDDQGAWTLSSRVVVRVNYATPQEGPLLTGLGLWLKADAGVTSDAGRVSAWGDQSGFGRNAVQPVAVPQPTLVTGGNGKPALSFDGVTNYMNFSMPLNGLSQLTVVAVANNISPQNPGGANEGTAILHWSETASWGALSIGVYQNSATWRFGTTQVQSGTPNFPGPAHTRPQSIVRNYSRTVVVKDGTTETLYTNGAMAIAVTGKLATLAGINEFGGNMGRGIHSGIYTYFRGEIQEILVYTNALSGAQLDDLDTYLRTKYWGQAQPNVAITGPGNATEFSAPSGLAITTDPSDSDGTIAKVEFFDSGTLVGTVTAAPWSFTIPNAAPGVHNLTAKVTDNDGLFNYSAPIFVFGRPASGFALLDNFESRALAPISFQGDWSGTFSEDVVRLDPTTFTGGNATNKVLRLAKGNQSLSMPALIKEGATGTLFFRAASTTWSRDDISFGFTDAPIYSYASVNEYEVQGRRYTGNDLFNKFLAVRDGSTLYTNSQSFNSDVWYKIWVVVDNSADKWKMFIQGGDYASPTPVDYSGKTVFDFFHGAAANDLVRFFLWTPLQSVSNGQNGGFWMDDIYLAMGENLADPTLPGPPALTIARSGDNVVISWPAAETGYILEATSSLSTPGWSDVTETPVQAGDQMTVTLSASSGPKFLRLRK